MSILDNRIILVTGAARGLGKAFALACAQAGARTVIVADILEDLGRATSEEIAATGVESYFVPLDLGDPQSIENLARVIEGKSGRLDGLLNNAAIATGIGGKTFDDIDIETWDKVMSVNVRGTWLIIKALAPLLRKSSVGGRIVNLASDTALWGAPRLLHYVASKGAIISMTRSLARELGEDRIAINAIAPGLVRVEATEYVPADRHALYENGRALKGAQHPDDVTGAAVFFLSSQTGFVTGQVLPVNGGFVFN